MPGSSDPIVAAIAEATLAAELDGVRIVGIDGPSGSGKSTLAVPLARALDAPLIPVDDFVSWNDFAGWWPRFEQQVLDPLFDGRDVRYQQRDWTDWTGDTLGPWRTVPWAPVVVVEGVTCTRAAISSRLACRVWVEAPPADRLRRGLQRDGQEHRGLWERWMREEASFFASDGAAGRADFRVSGIR
ncbi:uridine kinase family protein [Desertihabitans aurantiacus]|uniref:uridine kinase family protein n=1 Tax=Desertihabitans aurantiacus TaxID=2282477 RepID=UPI000DF761A7|nr:(d)CMP kinase [Desertihabitans aurantiacus]